jgi:predicted TIM-barrel fold metal-dependent hydrolase
MLDVYPLFDSHFHIIDPCFPLVPNHGYLPDAFTCEAYLQRMQGYDLRGGAVVSGSFQAFDQGYLLKALHTLGKGFVGVTQIPADTPDAELHRLNEAGVRAVRFNLKRGGSESIHQLEYMAHRVYELFRWHVELYVDAATISEIKRTLAGLPAVSIDHLGLSRLGLADVSFLLEQGLRLKVCGFGRVDFDVARVLPSLYAINPEALMFGTDLPSTRAPIPYRDEDYLLVQRALQDDKAIQAVFFDNASRFYGLSAASR